MNTLTQPAEAQTETPQSATVNVSMTSNSTADSGPASRFSPDNSANADLIASINGPDTSREQVIAQRTRRVVLSSMGVLREQKQGGRRSRAVATAVSVVVLALIAPLVWDATESLIAGERFNDAGSQLALWACVVCPTLLGAALVGGWWKRRS